MALIAACALTPGVYFAINAPASALGTTAQSAASAVASWGFIVTPQELQALARQVGETSLLSRTGGAPSLAVGMARIFSHMLGGSGAMALWYHFAIMFEALFILTTLDAGTRVGRFMLQDLGRRVWAPLGRTSHTPVVIVSSAVFVAMWGHFLWQGVIDPLGGINSLWPLFGISNQLLAAVALCVATTIVIKMGKARYAFVTLLPLAWITAVTMSAGAAKLFSPLPKLGFLAHARLLQASRDTGVLPPGVHSPGELMRMIFNDYLDAAVAAFFLVCVLVVLVASMREWYAVLRKGKSVVSTETPWSSAIIGRATTPARSSASSSLD
jgi:carbon starvation protein